jgi:hypothetical protein
LAPNAARSEEAVTPDPCQKRRTPTDTTPRDLHPDPVNRRIIKYRNREQVVTATPTAMTLATLETAL